VAVLFVPLLASALSGCSGGQPQAEDAHLPMASVASLPAEVLEAPVVVQQAYRYAAANSDILTHIPCYCGCGDMGHASNYACYISGTQPDGALIFDSHALGCSICVDITQDVMRMQAEGKDVKAMRAAIDATYSRYGPSNMP
jgi:hypothetical protein